MDDRKWNGFSEKEFESLLLDSLREDVPAEVVLEVTPWRQAMNRILWGLALTSVTLNFGLLNYLLPLAGVLMLLLGFRALRRENSWFTAAWWLSVGRMLLTGLLLADAAWIGSHLLPDAIASAVTLLVQLSVYLCLWQGLLHVREKAGQERRASAAGALVIWFLILCLLALVRYQGVVLGISMLVGWAAILRNLYRISREMEDTGYVLSASPVRIRDELLAGIALGLCVLLVVCGYLFGGKLPMNWIVRQETLGTEAVEVRDSLLKLGFPEKVLADLTEEEILACAGAKRVVTDESELPIDRGREESTVENNVTHIYTVHDEYVRITGVGVELPGQRERWRIFHHFEYPDGVRYPGTECVQLWPAWRNNKGWSAGGKISGEDFSGRLLYEDGRTYTASYYSLGAESYTANSIFWGQSQELSVFAEFSMPSGGNRHRGYLTYEILENIDGYIVDAWINLTHQWGRTQYPVLTAKESRMTRSGTVNGVFRTAQDALQFFPNEAQPEGQFTVIAGA